jgi:hypothetical protein
VYVARQQHGKNVAMATNARETTENFMCDPLNIKGKKAISSSQNFFFFSFK